MPALPGPDPTSLPDVLDRIDRDLHTIAHAITRIGETIVASFADLKTDLQVLKDQLAADPADSDAVNQAVAKVEDTVTALEESGPSQESTVL